MMTSKHLKGKGDQPILFPEDSHASLFPSPGDDEALRMTERSGRKCSELSQKSNLLGCLVKTLLESSEWNSTKCFLIWKTRAMTRKRLLFQLVPLVQNIDETGSGLFPTLLATEKSGGVQTPEKVALRGRSLRLRDVLGFIPAPSQAEQFMGYPEGWTWAKE